MVAAIKRKKAIERFEKITKGSEFIIDPDNYSIDLLKALNFYNINYDDKQKKKWYISHVAKTDKKHAAKLLKVDDYLFRYPGILTRLLDTGSELAQKELDTLEEKIQIIENSLSQIEEIDNLKKKSIVKQPTIQDRLEEQFHNICSEIDSSIDQYILNNTKFDVKSFFESNSVPSAILTKIKNFYQPRLQELADSFKKTDEDLVEGYSNLTRTKHKGLLVLFAEVVNYTEQLKAVAKVARKPRKRKPQSPAKVIQKLSYLKEFDQLKLKSINPTNLIDSKEIWLYNTKTKKLINLVSDGVVTMTVKGSSIIGFIPSKSFQTTLRKPVEFFDGLVLTKRPLTSKFRGLTSKLNNPTTGRVNKDTILLAAFK